MYTFLIVVQFFPGTVGCGVGGPGYAGMPRLPVSVWGGGVVKGGAGLGGGEDVTCGKRAVALAASIVCGLAWLAFVALSSGFGPPDVDG